METLTKCMTILAKQKQWKLEQSTLWALQPFSLTLP